MEKFREALEMILKNIIEAIDMVFLILEAPYIIVMSIFLYDKKCDFIYLWFPSFGVMSMWISDRTGKIDYSIDGHILIKKLFKK